MYHNLAEIESGLNSLATAYPAICQLLTMPNLTFEGRTVYGVRLGAEGDRLGVAFSGGIHAREWVNPEICLLLAADLLEAYQTGSSLAYGPVTYTATQVREVMEIFHIYIIPTTNPDGFNFSKLNDSIGGAGGWRRNRNPTESGGDPSCIGVDLNRNFDLLFNYPVHLSAAADTTRISTDPCNSNQVYHGPSPSSEAESKNTEWLLDAHPKIRWFFDIHSYTELILYPWGHDQNQTVDPTQNFLNPTHDGARGVTGGYSEYIDAGDLTIYQNLAGNMRTAIQAVNGRSYTVQQGFGLYPTTGTADDYVYSRHLADPTKSKVMGFTLETGRQFRPPLSEAEDVIREVSAGLMRFLIDAPCTTWPLQVTPPSPLEIDFRDIPEGLTTYRAAVFEVTGCEVTSVRIISGPTVTSGPSGTNFATPRGPTSETADPGPNFESTVYARIWISYTGTSNGDMATGTVRIRNDATNQEWDVSIRANTRARPTVAVALALDQSDSMSLQAGTTGAARVEVLREAVARFVELIPQNNGVGIVRFDHDAYPVTGGTYPGLPMTRLNSDAMSDPDRVLARNAALAHTSNPSGYTSIGDGVVAARNMLVSAGGYDEKAIVVFTDGIENRAEFISAVSGSIDNQTFVIGLGNESQVSTTGLMALAGVRNGYLLLTGTLTPDTDSYFRLTKYFHQIMAGVTRTDIVRDPDGFVYPGAIHRIPFDLTEADVEATVILLIDFPILRFWLETPEGKRVDAGTMMSAGGKFIVGTRMSFYRFGLPLPLDESAAHMGQWHAVVELDADEWKKHLSQFDDVGALPRSVRYNLSFHAYSNIHLEARVGQSGFKPGDQVLLSARITEYDVPLANRAIVDAQVQNPDGSYRTVSLVEKEPGRYEASFIALLAGTYHILIQANGKSTRQHPFMREQLHTAAVLRDLPSPVIPQPNPADSPIRDLICCLVEQESVQRWLKRNEINVDELRRCLDKLCCNEKKKVTAVNFDHVLRELMGQQSVEALMAMLRNHS